MSTPDDLLVARDKPYREAFEAQQRTLAAQQRASWAVQRAQERVQELETRLWGDEPSSGEAKKLRAALAKARGEYRSLADELARANRRLDGMAAERRGDWLRRAQADFQAARATYEQAINELAAAREQLAQEAQLIDYLDGKAPVCMGSNVGIVRCDIEGARAVDFRFQDVVIGSPRARHCRVACAGRRPAMITRGQHFVAATPRDDAHKISTEIERVLAEES